MNRPWPAVGFGWILAVVALILEIIFWATTKESGLWFYALVLTTLAVLL
jgi:hypothetical protein